MKDLTIKKVKTGKGIGGSRVAIIFAPPGAPPGSLTALMRYFNEQPHLRAIPGYYGPNQNHVLRISGLKDDTNFMQLLQEGFPAWQAEQDVSMRINVDAELTLEPIGDVDHFPHLGPMRKFIKNNANSMSGMAYMVGNLGLLMSGARKPAHLKADAQRDWFKIYSSLAYTVAGGLLLNMGRHMDNPRDVYSLMEEMYPKLFEVDDKQQGQIKDTLERTQAFFTNYVWETYSAICATGAAAHITSAAKRSTNAAIQQHPKRARAARYEMLSALGTITAMAISALVPEKEGRELIDTSDAFERKAEHSVLASAEQMQALEPEPEATMGLIARVSDIVRESPLAVAAGVQSFSNIGYGVSALRRQPIDGGLFAMSASFLTGNAIQTQATKGRGPGFDDVATAAATIISSDPQVDQLSPAQLQQRVARFANILSKEQEVVHSEKRLTRGITERLKRYSNSPMAPDEDTLTGFIPSEQLVLKQSPFISPHRVERSLASKSGAGMAL